MGAAAFGFDKNHDNTLAITLSGEWLLSANLPATDAVLDELRRAPRPLISAGGIRD